MRQPFVLPFKDSLAHPRRNGNCRFYESLAESLANSAAYHHPHYFSGTRYARMKRRRKRGREGEGRARKGLYFQSRQASQSMHVQISVMELRRIASVQLRHLQTTVFVTSASGAHMFAFAGLSGRLSLESGLRAVSECKIEFACVVVEPSIRQGRPLRCIA
jgi:hypothetical protein